MPTELLDGKKLAQSIRKDLKDQVTELFKSTNQKPRIVNLIVGNDPSSCAYANSQKRVAQQIGIDYELVSVPESIQQDELISKITKFNEDPSVHGIMLHKPIPEHLNYGELADVVNIHKDLEGINVANIGRMILKQTNIIPCTPAAVMAHLKSLSLDFVGKEVVIIGHSHIVGKPLSLLLLNELATVTICHIGTSKVGKLEEHTSKADIVIVAVGKPNLLNGSMIKEGAIVIDVGINQLPNGKIVGDVDFSSVQDKASYATPVPGGVGPVTVTMLMKNAVETFKEQVQGAVH